MANEKKWHFNKIVSGCTNTPLNSVYYCLLLYSFKFETQQKSKNIDHLKNLVISSQFWKPSTIHFKIFLGRNLYCYDYHDTQFRIKERWENKGKQFFFNIYTKPPVTKGFLDTSNASFYVIGLDSRNKDESRSVFFLEL